MAKKTTEQQFEERLKELRGELGSEEDKLEKLEKAYAKEVSILEGQELEDFENEIKAQRYIVKQKQEQIDDLKKDKSDLESERAEANNFKWKEVEPVKHRWQAGVLEAKNIQTGHRTVITIDQSKYNTGVKDDYFTTRYMEQQ